MGWEWQRRLSLCCAEEGCRKRATPPSVRFLGRRVYMAAIVVLASVLYGGFSEERARQAQASLGVPRRTLARWVAWWREQFVDSRVWRAGRDRFMPPVVLSGLPATLLERFRGVTPEDRLQECLEFVSPLTTGSCRREAGSAMGF